MLITKDFTLLEIVIMRSSQDVLGFRSDPSSLQCHVEIVESETHICLKINLLTAEAACSVETGKKTSNESLYKYYHYIII